MDALAKVIKKQLLIATLWEALVNNCGVVLWEQYFWVMEGAKLANIVHNSFEQALQKSVESKRMLF